MSEAIMAINHSISIGYEKKIFISLSIYIENEMRHERSLKKFYSSTVCIVHMVGLGWIKILHKNEIIW